MDAVENTLKYYGRIALRADKKAYKTALWDNVQAYIDACETGIAVFDYLTSNYFNPNVSLEVGYFYGAVQARVVAERQSIADNAIRFGWAAIQAI